MMKKFSILTKFAKGIEQLRKRESAFHKNFNKQYDESVTYKKKLFKKIAREHGGTIIGSRGAYVYIPDVSRKKLKKVL